MWRTIVQAQEATSQCFAMDAAQSTRGASTSSLTHSYGLVTRSESARVAILTETAAHMAASAVESDAFHDQQELHQADLDGDDPKCNILLDLPADRMIKSAQPGKRPESLFTYQFLKLCAACGLFHPNFTRNSSSYFMRTFIGPRIEIPTHHRRSLPPPTTFYHNDVFRLSNHAMNDTIYGHHSEGIYLSPLAVEAYKTHLAT
jgi:hypothetical protein